MQANKTNKYYKIYNKKSVLIGIGFSAIIPENCKDFSYVQITEKQYNKINKEQFNAK